MILIVGINSADAQSVKECSSCKGKGHIGVCDICGGNGAIYTFFGPMPCVKCGGSGKIICIWCQGAGYIVSDDSSKYNSSNSGHSTGSYNYNYNSDNYNSSSSSSSPSRCSRCGGTGSCKRCGGTGRVNDWGPMSIVTKEKYDKKCGVCNGTGKCGVCGGKGVL